MKKKARMITDDDVAAMERLPFAWKQEIAGNLLSRHDFESSDELIFTHQERIFASWLLKKWLETLEAENDESSDHIQPP